MDYDKEIERLKGEFSRRMAQVTGKPDDRERALLRLLTEFTDAVKTLVRAKTLEFYEKRGAEAPTELFPGVPTPTFTLKPQPPPPGTNPPVIG